MEIRTAESTRYPEVRWSAGFKLDPALSGSGVGDTVARMNEGSAARFSNVRLGTGVRLHYVERGNHDGEPVVFLHGWPDSWFSFSLVLPHLPDSLRAVAVDQRGFGDSDRPESGYSIPELAADVIDFLDALEIERATLVGHSFGSFVARYAAFTQPQRVAALVLIGTEATAAGSDLLGGSRASRFVDVGNGHARPFGDVAFDDRPSDAVRPAGRRSRPCFRASCRAPASVPLPTFASHCSTLECERRKQRVAGELWG